VVIILARFVIPEARFYEARNEPIKPAIWNPETKAKESLVEISGSQISINL
jgi:hypothetical protein